MRDNPFQNTDVSGIYDNVDHPEVLSYCREQKQQLLDVIAWYKKRKFSNPVINIFGRTGSGKTFLLYSLTREFHEQRKGFFIDISPFDVVEEKDIGKVTEYIWQEIDTFFEKNIVTQSIEYKPVDFFIYKIYDKVTRRAEKKEDAICYKPGMIWSEKVPIYTNFTKFLEGFKTHKHKERILKRVFAQEKNSRILSWLKNKFLQREMKLESNGCKSIGELSNFCLSFDVPLILVCDQFENLDKSNYAKPVGIFFTQILMLIRMIKVQNCSAVPLFINLLNSTSVDLLAHHINTRIPTLPNGQDRITLDSTLDKEKALNVTQTYLQNKNQHVEKFYPFTREEIEMHYDLYAKHQVCNLRTWLIYCRHLWDVRFYNAKPYWNSSHLEQESSSDSGEKIEDITKNNNVELVRKENNRDDVELKEQVDKNDILDDRQSAEGKSIPKSFEENKIQVYSLDDICHSSLNSNFFKIWKFYQEQPEKLLELLYIFMESLKNELGFSNMSPLNKNYFFFGKDDRKIYIFFTSKSNRGKGFLTAWNEFRNHINKSESYFVKCIRSKGQDIPNGKEFSSLRSNRGKSHYYSFDIENKYDLNWLKCLYGTIYLLGNEKKLEKNDLLEFTTTKVVWHSINSDNIEENILRRLKEDFLEGIV